MPVSLAWPRTGIARPQAAPTTAGTRSPPPQGGGLVVDSVRLLNLRAGHDSCDGDEMHPSESVSARNDVRRATVAASVGTVIEAYDIVIYGFFAVILAEQFFPRSSPTAALLDTFAIYAVGFAIRPLGALAFGHVGDRRGRRPALVGTLLLMAVASGCVALLPTYRTIGLWAPLLLLICRLVQGFAIGG